MTEPGTASTSQDGDRVPRLEGFLLSGLAVWLVVFFTPLEILLANPTEFASGLVPILLGLLAASILLSGALYGLTSRWTVLRPVVAIVGFSLFVQSAFLYRLADHQPFDGEPIAWHDHGAISAIELAVLAAIAAVGALLTRRRKATLGFAFVIWFWLGVGLVQSLRGGLPELYATEEPSAYFDRFTRLSTEKNVIHVVVDHTQGSLVHDILTSDETDLSTAFDGFTLYVNAAGIHPSTYPSISFLMSGRAPSVGNRFVPHLPFTHEYIRETLDAYSLVNPLTAAGWETFGFHVNPIYAYGDYTATIAGEIFDGNPVRKTLIEKASRDILSLWDLALFRTAPILLRSWIYNDEQWRLRNLTGDDRTISGIVDVFIRDLTADGALTGTYNFFHHAGGHPPTQFDADESFIGPQERNQETATGQVIGTLRQLGRLVERLKQLSLFDQTMIVIVGDHGSAWRSPLIRSRTGSVVAPRIISSANPVLLVKLPGARGPLEISKAPVTNGDIPATVMDVFGLEPHPLGAPITSIAEDSRRERVYLWSVPDARVFGKQQIESVMPYRIRGDIFDQYDWIPPLLAPSAPAPRVLAMSDERAPEYTQGLGRLRPGDVYRFVEGKLARFYLAAPAYPVELVIELGIRRPPAGQSMTVKVNGRVVGRLAAADLEERERIVLPVGADLPLEDINVVELEMETAIELDGGARSISLQLRSVGFASS